LALVPEHTVEDAAINSRLEGVTENSGKDIGSKCFRLAGLTAEGAPIGWFRRRRR
jgi:hypothetical protein